MNAPASPPGAQSPQPHFEQAADLPIFHPSTLELPQSITPYLILTLILPIFAIAPLFYPGYIQTHSGFVPLWNVADLRANFGDLTWLPHIAHTFDPLRSDGLLPYYLAAILPVSPVAAVKVVLGAGWLLGSLGMFLWLRRWLGNPGALIAALVYTYLPYQIVTVYVRGAWGEALFLGMLPWVILAATYLVTSPQLKLVPLAAFFWLLLGMSQLGLAVWAFIFALTLLLAVHSRQMKLPLLAMFPGLLLAAALNFSLAPAITSSLEAFKDHFLYPAQLFSAYWGFGVSRAGFADGLSLQLGLAAIGLSLLALMLWQRRAGASVVTGRADRRLMFFAGAVVVLSLLQLGAAPFLWNLPLWPGHVLGQTLTFPWQLLGLTGLSLAVLAGAALWLDPQLTRFSLFAAVVVLITLSSYSYLEPQFIQVEMDRNQPEAQLGAAQLVLLDHDFSVVTSGHTAGLERGETTIPLDIHGPLQPGDQLSLNVVWQPLQPFSENLKIFVHLADTEGNVLAQFDGQPRSGDYPTSQWVPGELIDDSYPVRLPEDPPADPYQVYLGLYNEATTIRLPVPTGSEGRVVLNLE